MEYRRLGDSGLRVSALSYGTWITFGEQGGFAEALENLTLARERGVNLFDTAEAYGLGQAEELLGTAIEELGWERATYCLSTKLYWGRRDAPNLCRTLNRKYLLHSIDECLERLRTPYVDILYCHRFDPETSVEEVVWAMSDIVAANKAIYWGTSEWPPERIREAHALAERFHLRKPVTEQVEYNLLCREKVERRYAPVHAELGLGIATWSPLASGLLSGKYVRGMPAQCRASLPAYAWLRPRLGDAHANRRVAAVGAVARELQCTTAQLAIAWCLANPRVSTVTLGARSASQLDENLRSLEVVARLSEEVLSRIDRSLGAEPAHVAP